MSKRMITIEKWELEGQLSEIIKKLKEYQKTYGKHSKLEIEDLGPGCSTCGWGGGIQINIIGE